MDSIQTNLGANSALLNVATSGANLNKEITRLSSGFRINSAGDDAAGLAIANTLRAQGASLTAASQNAAQATSMLQIADGATNTISTMIDRMKELATEANSDNIGSQRDKLNDEFQQLIQEINRIANTTQYQGTGLLNGALGATIDSGSTAIAVTGVGAGAITASNASAGTYNITADTTAHTLTMTKGGLSQTISNAAGAQTLNFSFFGISINTGAGYVQDSLGAKNVTVDGGSAQFMVSSSGNYGTSDLIKLSGINLTSDALGFTTGGGVTPAVDLLTDGDAQTALNAIDTAENTINTAIGNIGAAESRLGFASTNVATISQNVTAAESTIRDADMAAETTQFTKDNILQQAGMAMIAQANSSAANVLTLLR